MNLFIFVLFCLNFFRLKWANSGGQLLEQILIRDPNSTNSTYNLCQIGLNDTDKNALEILIKSYMDTMVTKIFGSSRRRRQTPNVVVDYSCSKLKQIGKGVISLKANQLAQINQTEFAKCITTLGTITNWSPDQLSSLASLAIQVKYNIYTPFNEYSMTLY